MVDVGCGAGLDCLIASRMVGQDGQVIGIDMTPEMITKAQQNTSELGLTNVNFIAGYDEELPIPTAWANLVISNGAINLSPDKDTIFSEMFRVIKPGGVFRSRISLCRSKSQIALRIT